MKRTRLWAAEPRLRDEEAIGAALCEGLSLHQVVALESSRPPAACVTSDYCERLAPAAMGRWALNAHAPMRPPPTAQVPASAKLTFPTPSCAGACATSSRAMSKTTITDRALPKPADIHPSLHLLYSPESGICEQVEALRVGGGATYLGREIADGEGIRLAADDKASRRHARIECDQLDANLAQHLPSQARVRLRIIDEQSKNGCFVNGVRISEKVLADGDLIRVGDSLLLLRWQPTEQPDGPEHGIVGRSASIAALRYRLQVIAQATDKTVLLLGEPGVGKELAAQSLHEQSRLPGRFVPFNCASLSESLADSILYGHERGAFTGADRRADGLFQTAAQGTLFLDEVGELPLGVQGKLLRALNERVVNAVGRSLGTRVHVRVIAATNRDLEKEVRAGRFRDDLYSRLRDDVVQLPALSERREDILILLQNFVGAEARFTPPLAAALLQYAWPHNVRELRQFAHALQRAAGDGRWLDLPLVADRFQCEPAPGEVSSIAPPGQLVSEAIDRSQRPSAALERLSLTKDQLRSLLQEKNWNVSAVARAIQRSRRQVRRWMEKFELT